MPNKPMSDAEYGRHIREQSKKYWLRYRAVQALKDRWLEEHKVVFTEEQILAEMKKQAAAK